MPDLSAYKITPASPDDSAAMLLGTTVVLHDAGLCEEPLAAYLDHPTLSAVLRAVTEHEVKYHSRRPKTTKEDLNRIAAWAQGKGMTVSTHKEVADAARTLTPVDHDVTHRPEKWCRHPECKATNWGGRDRLHTREPECPPDEGWVAKGDDRDREATLRRRMTHQRCANPKCGHVRGGHSLSDAIDNPTRGRCLNPDCYCPAFEESADA